MATGRKLGPRVRGYLRAGHSIVGALAAVVVVAALVFAGGAQGAIPPVSSPPCCGPSAAGCG